MKTLRFLSVMAVIATLFTCLLDDDAGGVDRRRGILRPGVAGLQPEISATPFPRNPQGRIIYVDQETGDDANDGLSRRSAIATISRGAQILKKGDRMIVSPGVYYEQPEFYTPGSSTEKPVWILAEPRGEVTISAMWPEAALGQVHWRDEGEGIYSAPHGAALFGSFEATFLFRCNTVDDLRTGWAEAVEVYLPPYGFAVRNDSIFVKLPGGVDPNGRELLFSPPSWDESGWITGVVEVYNSPYLIIDGFRIEGSGTSGIYMDPRSVAPTIRNTILSFCVMGLRLPDDGLVEWCEYSYPGFHDFAEDVRLLNSNGVRSVYTLVKEYHSPVKLEGGLAETYGSQGLTSNYCEFRYNFIHDSFDGERLGEFEYSESHHNVYMYNYDNHNELEIWAGFGSRELYLHDCLFLACPMGPLSHQGSAIVGPQYVYRNIVYGLDEHGWPSWTQIKSWAPNSTEGIHYYHNLIWGARGGLFWDTRENLHFLNNIFIFSDNLDAEEGVFDSDYNLLVNNVDKSWLYGVNGEYLGDDPDTVGFLDVESLNFGLAAGSPAEDAGIVIPGFNDQAPGGPDIGPFEIGEDPGNEWPRPRETAFTETIPERWIFQNSRGARGRRIAR